LLLDANVWLFVYGPHQPGDRKVAVYSNALKRMLVAESRIYVDVLVVSEFINRYAGLKWEIEHEVFPSFKEFRKSKEFKPLAQEIADAVKRALRHCTRIESGFESPAVDSLIDEYSMGCFDFNDQILTALCKEKGLKLVTDDGDFRTREIPIVTGNRHLLA